MANVVHRVSSILNAKVSAIMLSRMVGHLLRLSLGKAHGGQRIFRNRRVKSHGLTARTCSRTFCTVLSTVRMFRSVISHAPFLLLTRSNDSQISQLKTSRHNGTTNPSSSPSRSRNGRSIRHGRSNTYSKSIQLFDFAPKQ